MKETTALIFGFNKFAIEIANNVVSKYKDVKIFSLNEEDVHNKDYDITHFDLSEDWNELEEEFDLVESLAFCVLEDDAQNIFLTISLRSNFKDLTIITIAKDMESVNKLNMAGANKVIPLVETTAEIITNMIEKPIATKVLHSILYEESDLKIAQIKVENATFFHGKFPVDIEWSRYKGIIVLSIMHENMSSDFIYSSKAKHHEIKDGDIFVIVGYEADIVEFEKLIGSRCNVSWNNWGR